MGGRRRHIFGLALGVGIGVLVGSEWEVNVQRWPDVVVVESQEFRGQHASGPVRICMSDCDPRAHQCYLQVSRLEGLGLWARNRVW